MVPDRAPPRPLSRKLPRNVRRTALAQRVGERSGATREAQTPTPAPATVDVRDGQIAQAFDFPAPPATKSSYVTLLAFLALAAFVAVALRHAAEGLPVPLRSRADLVALVTEVGPNARAAGARIASAAMGAPEPATPAIEDDRPVLRREGHVSLHGGILVFPESFQPDANGEFDVYVHFHGNTAVVKESAETAKLDAAVAIINLGIGSAPYEEYYSVPGTYEELLDDVAAGVERRGLEHARVRRVALGAWSAGYGAISTILQVRKKTDRLDAILIFDGIHCGWENGALNPRQMRPFADAAASAARGEIFFGITHSNIDPRAYASTTATADYLLESVGATSEAREPELDGPAYLELESMKGAVSKRREKHMEPTREARKGDFHVTGYRGDTKEHHMAHLFQMGATLLPELVARWKK